MKNVTITLDTETASWAREHAARKNMSLSRFVGELLSQNMREAAEYDLAMRKFLSRAPVNLKPSGERYPSRDESHERSRLR